LTGADGRAALVAGLLIRLSYAKTERHDPTPATDPYELEKGMCIFVQLNQSAVKGVQEHTAARTGPKTVCDPDHLPIAGPLVVDIDVRPDGSQPTDRLLARQIGSGGAGLEQQNKRNHLNPSSKSPDPSAHYNHPLMFHCSLASSFNVHCGFETQLSFLLYDLNLLYDLKPTKHPDKLQEPIVFGFL
jgi:hypothetical protein